MERWRKADSVVLIDAVSSGAAAGSLHRLDGSRQPVPAVMWRHSTHAFSVAEAVELARALNRLPQRIVIFGVEGRCFDPGQAVSPEVEFSVADLVRQITQEMTGSCTNHR